MKKGLAQNLEKSYNQISDMVDNNYKFKDMMNEMNITKSELLLIMYKLISTNTKIAWHVKFYITQEYLKNFSFTTLKDSKVLIMSDTHLASLEENISYLEQVSDFVKKKNIKTIFHGGDIGDGMVKYQKDYNSYTSQVDHILDIYPEFDDVTQYIMGGNHDRRYRDKNLDLLKLLEQEKKNIIGVGYYQSYFKIFDKVISFEHNSHMNTTNQLVNSIFKILGHSHEAIFKDNAVKLPTLSDSMPNKSNENNNPGFLTLETSKQKDNVNLSFDLYNVSENEIKKIKRKKYTIR